MHFMVLLAFSKTENVEEFPKVFQVFDSLRARVINNRALLIPPVFQSISENMVTI